MNKALNFTSLTAVRKDKSTNQTVCCTDTCVKFSVKGERAARFITELLGKKHTQEYAQSWLNNISVC